VRLCIALFLALSMGVVSPALAVELGAQLDGSFKETNFKTPKFTADSMDSLRWQIEIEEIGAQYLRLRLNDITGQPPEGTTLRLRDRSGRVVREYSGSELLAKGMLWTPIVNGGYVLVTLHSAIAPVDFGLRIDRVAYQTYGGAPLSTVGVDEKEPIANYSNDQIVSQVSRPIAKLIFMENSKPYTCTGFLIGSNKLMTNHHCVQSQEVCATAVAIFGYQLDNDGLLQFGEQFECVKFVETQSNYELDYSVLELQGEPGSIWGSITLTAGDPSVNDAMFIVQHPAGEPKKISKINCAANAVPVKGRGTATDFTHSCDTVGGSSGSPIFASSGNIVGLHHYGFGEGGEWSENRGIRMKRIVEKLEVR
jgi:V8-like Glu-specific endopeptidase